MFSNLSRQLQWAFNQQTAMRSSSTEGHGPGGGFIRDMILKINEGKPSTSHLFDVGDTITAGNGNVRKSKEVHDQQVGQKKFGNIESIASGEWNYIRSNCYYNFNRSNIEKTEYNPDVDIVKKEIFGRQYGLEVIFFNRYLNYSLFQFPVIDYMYNLTKTIKKQILLSRQTRNQTK